MPYRPPPYPPVHDPRLTTPTSPFHQRQQQMDKGRRRREEERQDEFVVEPTDKLYFNAPFVNPQQCDIRLTNRTKDRRRVAWVFKSTNLGRFQVKPTIGQLAWGASVLLKVTCLPLKGDYRAEARRSRGDRMTIEWIELDRGAPPLPPGKMNSTWFSKAGRKWRHSIGIVYNV